MALTVTAPGAGSKVGPGIQISLHSSLVGAIANDDIFVAELYTPGPTGNFFALAADFAHGFHDRSLKMCTNLTDVGFITAFYDHDIAPGAACTVIAYLCHHNLTVIDGPSTINGFVWDPTSGLYTLVVSPVGDIGAILAAVTKTVVNRP